MKRQKPIAPMTKRQRRQFVDWEFERGRSRADAIAGLVEQGVERTIAVRLTRTMMKERPPSDVERRDGTRRTEPTQIISAEDAAVEKLKDK